MNIVEQDILTIREDAVICHQVNCIGVMGGGLALQVREQYPDAYDVYKAKDDWRLGDCQIVHVGNEIYIANLAGQKNIGTGLQTDYKALAQALRVARDFADANELELALPYMMGCGLAGGNWDIVSDMIEQIAPNATVYKLPKE